jgi:hypothetical protein
MNFDMSIVFQKNEQIIFKEVDAAPALIDPYRRTLVTLNPTAFQIWQLLDGAHSVAAIVEQLKSELEVEDKILNKDIVGFLKDLIKREMIQECSVR